MKRPYRSTFSSKVYCYQTTSYRAIQVLPLPLNHMILEIEFWKGDILLQGRKTPRHELQKQLKHIEEIYDRDSDNFVELLCRVYGWTKVDPSGDPPSVTFDRDTMLLK